MEEIVMKTTHRNRAALRWLAAGAGLVTAFYASHAAYTWLRYGYPSHPSSDEADQLLDKFIPVYEVVERHQVRVASTSRDRP
jgi:hypothetical protein